ENKLIVDLMIDELKAISLPDSIHLKKAFDIETFPTLFQMTSTIEAQLKPKVSFTNIFKALFPCGSITGTPKIETINFINKIDNFMVALLGLLHPIIQQHLMYRFVLYQLIK